MKAPLSTFIIKLRLRPPPLLGPRAHGATQTLDEEMQMGGCVCCRTQMGWSCSRGCRCCLDDKDGHCCALILCYWQASEGIEGRRREGTRAHTYIMHAHRTSPATAHNICTRARTSTPTNPRTHAHTHTRTRAHTHRSTCRGHSAACTCLR